MLAASQASKKERINSITGVVTSEVDRTLVINTLVAAGVDTRTSYEDTATEVLIVTLWTYLDDSVPKEKKTFCTRCLAVGNSDDDTCSFCGSDEGAETLVKAKVQRAQRLAGSTPAEKGKKMTTVVDSTAQVSKEKKNGKAHLAVVDDTTASSAIVTESALDENVKEVFRLKSAGAVSMYQLGLAIADNINRKLWVLRTPAGEKKGARWKTFEAFCKHEYMMTPTNARSLADVSATYSEQQVRAFGTTTLGLVLQVPPEDQPKLLEQAEKGATTREIKEEVKKVKKEKGHTRATRNASGAGGKRSEKAVKAKTATITIANMLGAETVKLYKKPPSIEKVEDWDKMPRAKNLGHQPYGFLELPNGVVMHFTLATTPGGDMVLRIQTKRN